MKLTLSVIKADIGGWVGHCGMHPDLMADGEASLAKAKSPVSSSITMLPSAEMTYS